MASLLLKNGYIITVNGSRDVIRNGWIHIEGDSIRGIGPMESFQSEPGDRADETIDLHGMIVIPGLINGHNHHWASLFKNTGEGLLLEPWLDQVTIPLMLQLTHGGHAGRGLSRRARADQNGDDVRAQSRCERERCGLLWRRSSSPLLSESGVRQNRDERGLVIRRIRLISTNLTRLSESAPADIDEEFALAGRRCLDRWEGQGGLLHTGLALETGANWMLHNATSDEIDPPRPRAC